MRAGAALALAAGVLLACASDGDRPAAPAAAGSPGGAVEREASEEEEMIAVTGRVTATGSDPLVILVIVTRANEQYELVGAQADPLWDLQQRRVTVRGRIVRPPAGPGFPAQLEVHSHALASP